MDSEKPITANRSVLFVFRRNRKELLEKWRAGKSPDDFFYGLLQMQSGNLNVDFVEGDDSLIDLKRLICLPLESLISRIAGIGFGLHIVWRNWKRISSSDILISTVDTCGLPLSMLKFMGVLSQPLIYFSQGLSDRIECLSDNFINRFIKKKYTQWIGSVNRIVVLGNGAVQSMEKTFNLSHGTVSAVHFGVDDNFWSPGDMLETKDYILSVGSDQARDYDTLVKAAGEYPLHIVTRLKINNISPSQSVTAKSEYSALQLRDLYRNCRFVVIPIKDISQPSGQSATLQAMACGKTVILTRTSGLWDTSIMINNENCILVPPNNPGALRDAINHLWQNPEISMNISKSARKTVESHYSSRIFADRIMEYINETSREVNQ